MRDHPSPVTHHPPPITHHPPPTWHWLASAEGESRIAEAAAEAGAASAGLVARLRRTLTAERTSLVLEQAELRRRARVKFAHPERMLFTRVLLEQATDEPLARLKAERFPQGVCVGDLCCGLGGDLLGLVARGPVLGVDRDPVALWLARHNLLCQPTDTHAGYGATDPPSTRWMEADLDLDMAVATDCDWLHIDPDRRADGDRSTRLEQLSPAAPTLRRLVQQCLGRGGGVSIKLAPATEIAGEDEARWLPDAEREWLGSRRECRQQLLHCGALARHPGEHSATVIGAGGSRDSLHGVPRNELETTAAPGRYVYEPHAAVLAAHLAAEFAARHALRSLAPQGGYLTGDLRLDTPLASAFEVIESLPFDERRLRRLLTERGIGRLEVKRRGLAESPEAIQRRLRPRGDHSATLLVTRASGHSIAILAQRLE